MKSVISYCLQTTTAQLISGYYRKAYTCEEAQWLITDFTDQTDQQCLAMVGMWPMSGRVN